MTTYRIAIGDSSFFGFATICRLRATALPDCDPSDCMAVVTFATPREAPPTQLGAFRLRSPDTTSARYNCRAGRWPC